MKNRVRLEIVDDEALLEGIGRGDIAALERLPIVASHVAPVLRIDQHQCDTCDETATMQVKLVKSIDDKGKDDEDDDLGPRYLLTRDSRSRIDALAAREPTVSSDVPAETETGDPHPAVDSGTHR